MAAQSTEVLPALLSLDITAGLVRQGARAPWRAGAEVGDQPSFTIPILDASNTSPIVITVTASDLSVLSLREGRVMHVVVAGVLGNGAANKLDPITLRNEAWVAIVTSAEGSATATLALYDLDASTGALVSSVGSRAYTGGGTLSRGLIDGRVLIGREHTGDESAAPRIVFVPLRVTFGSRSEASPWTTSAIDEGEPDREELAQAIATKTVHYEVHVWGKGASSLSSFTATDLLYEQVIRSAHKRCAGVYELQSGDYLDQHENAPQRLKYGHEFVFTLGLSMPINDEAAEFGEGAITVETALTLQINGGTPEPI